MRHPSSLQILSTDVSETIRILNLKTTGISVFRPINQLKLFSKYNHKCGELNLIETRALHEGALGPGYVKVVVRLTVNPLQLIEIIFDQKITIGISHDVT